MLRNYGYTATNLLCKCLDLETADSAEIFLAWAHTDFISPFAEDCSSRQGGRQGTTFQLPELEGGSYHTRPSYTTLEAVTTIPCQALLPYHARCCSPSMPCLFYLIAPFHALHTLQEPAISYYVIWYHTKVALYHKTFPSKAHHIMVHIHTPTIQTTPAHSLLLLALYHNNVLQWHTILDYE